MYVQKYVIGVLIVILMCLATPVFATGWCTITFDGGCPNTSPLCGATFVGGYGCNVEPAPCWDTGPVIFKVAAPLVILLDPGITELEVFFVHNNFYGPGSGIMRFYDASNQEVGTLLATNGECHAGPLPRQSRSFATPVIRITVKATGDATAYIDTMMLGRPSVATESLTWSRIKALYF